MTHRTTSLLLRLVYSEFPIGVNAPRHSPGTDLKARFADRSIFHPPLSPPSYSGRKIKIQSNPTPAMAQSPAQRPCCRDWAARAERTGKASGHGQRRREIPIGLSSEGAEGKARSGHTQKAPKGKPDRALPQPFLQPVFVLTKNKYGDPLMT
jgi:hypothetical protein